MPRRRRPQKPECMSTCARGSASAHARITLSASSGFTAAAFSRLYLRHRVIASCATTIVTSPPSCVSSDDGMPWPNSFVASLLTPACTAYPAPPKNAAKLHTSSSANMFRGMLALLRRFCALF